MSALFPFKAVRPSVEQVKAVATPPYDVVSTEEAAALAVGKPLSFFHVSRAEIDLPPGTPPYSPAVYEMARVNCARLRQDVPLLAERESVFFVYALEMDGRRQTGLVATVAVDEYARGLIKRHEKTRRDKEDDRTRHILTLRSQTGPVFLTCRQDPRVDALVARITQGPTLFDFVADDGIRHIAWRVPAPADIAALRAAFAAVPALYIADGHHRAASAARVRDHLRQENPNHTGEEEYNRFLAVIFPDNQLRILPYNRLVKDLNGLTAAGFIAKCRTAFDLRPAARPAPDEPGTFHMFIDGAWWSCTRRDTTAALSPIDRLDVSLLQNLVLAPLLGIDDPRTSNRIEFVGGIRGTDVLEERVRSGAAAVAFSMFPTTVGQLMAIADAGGIMPPKSTWFEPKLRDALFIHDI